MINWMATKEELIKLHDIAKRAVDMFPGKLEFMDIEMDITACHLNGQPLDLDRLLTFEDFDFAHDISGINRHIDRETGEIQDRFVARCAI